MKSTILRQLDHIEKEHGVSILLACESGSRAWGFPSADSDYDVRFIYAHDRDWYLSVFDKRDVIERPIDKVLDISGWDLRKALRLLRNSNAPLLEWLSSPIRYQCRKGPVADIAALAEKSFLPASCCHHYLSMAKNSMAKSTAGGAIRAKTYLYALRPVLCCEWIIEHGAQPPVRMADLISAIPMDRRVKERILHLIELKKDRSEAFCVERSHLIDAYLEQRVAEIETHMPENPPKPPSAAFDAVFRDILEGMSSTTSNAM